LNFNGRFVVFASEATNLINPNTKFPQGYARDTCIGTDSCTPLTLLVSSVTGGTAGSPTEGNAQGGAMPTIGAQAFLPPSGSGIPPAGRFIGFLSAATNLVTPNTTLQQAFVRDTCLAAISPPMCTPATVLASVTQGGGEPNGAASGFTFASNTCNSAFVSAATDVVIGVAIPNQIYLTSCSAGFPSGAFTTSTSLVFRQQLRCSERSRRATAQYQLGRPLGRLCIDIDESDEHTQWWRTTNLSARHLRACFAWMHTFHYVGFT
jgi:hypothetical protein